MGTCRPQIVLLGDSITELSIQGGNSGWGTLLAEHYSRKADVLFRGFVGYTSRWTLCLLDKLFPFPSSNPPALVTVFLGANDAAIPESTHHLLSVPVKEYGENLHRIVSHLKNLPETQIVLLTPPPVTEEGLLNSMRDVYGDESGILVRRNAVTKLYAEECVKVAKETGLPVINIWCLFQEIPNWEEKFLCDGIHLSVAGNAKVFEELVKVIDETDFLPTLKASDLPFDVPYFEDLLKANDPIAVLKAWATTK